MVIKQGFIQQVLLKICYATWQAWGMQQCKRQGKKSLWMNKIYNRSALMNENKE